MKTVLALLAALALYVAGPADAQTRTVRHPAVGTPAITVDVLDGWSTTIDTDNNLIVGAPNSSVAFSLTVADEDPDKTLEEFAQTVLSLANATGVKLDGEGLFPPYAGNTYLANMTMSGRTLGLKMIIASVPNKKIVSATLISGPSTTDEEKAVGELILKTIRVVD